MPRGAAPTQHLPLGRQDLPREALKLPPENPKYPITRDKLDGLKASIKLDPSMMLPRPIGVADGPEHRMGGFVWGGTQRVTALAELYTEGWQPPEGLWEPGLYPCVVQDIDRDTCLERLNRDNHQWAEWDPSKAQALLEDLKGRGRDPAAMGWDQQRMNSLLEQARALQAPPPADNPPPPPEADAPPPPEGGAPASEPNGSANGTSSTAFLDEHAAAGDPDLRFPADAHPPQLGDDLHEFALRLTVEQRDTIMHAVHAQRRRDPDQTTAEALTTICQEWSSEDGQET